MDRRGSYISSQLSVINDKLQLLYDEIGISQDERDARERTLYSAVSQALEQQVKQVTLEKEELERSCSELREQLAVMATALQDLHEFDDASDNLDVKTPLRSTFENLKSRHETLQGMYQQRHKMAEELFARLHTYSSAMDGIDLHESFLNSGPDTISLTNSNIAALEAEVTRLADEYSHRINLVQEDANQVVTLWAQLGTSQCNIDREILAYYKDAPEKLGLSNSALERLRTKKSLLQQEKENRMSKLSTLKAAVQHLWSKLSEDEAMIKAFDRSNRGIALSVIDAYEQELARLNEKKRDFMHIFIKDARQTLQKLWDSLYFCEDEMLEFTPAWTDIFTDASLAAHESEITRLEQLLHERKPILALIDGYRELQNDVLELEESQQDASRLTSRGGGRRDPSRLLREEQMRKRIAKRKPKIVAELMAALNKWEQETERPFMVNGERFIEVLRDEEQAAKAVKAKKTPARPTAASVSRSASVSRPATAALSATEKLGTKTPRSIRRDPLQVRDTHQQDVKTAPRQPNFFNKPLVDRQPSNRAMDAISPLSFNTASRIDDTLSSTGSDKSMSSPLKSRTLQGRSVSAAATIPPIPRLSQNDGLPTDATLRAKSAAGAYKPLRSVTNLPRVLTSTPKQEISVGKRRLAGSTQKLMPSDSHASTTPSIGNLVTDYNPESAMHAKNLGKENQPVSATLRPRPLDEMYSGSQAPMEDSFVDDYDDACSDYANSVKSFDPARSVYGGNNLRLTRDSYNDPLVAIDQLSLENNFRASAPILLHKDEADIFFDNAEISFISPQKMLDIS